MSNQNNSVSLETLGTVIALTILGAGGVALINVHSQKSPETNPAIEAKQSPINEAAVGEAYTYIKEYETAKRNLQKLQNKLQSKAAQENIAREGYVNAKNIFDTYDDIYEDVSLSMGAPLALSKGAQKLIKYREEMEQSEDNWGEKLSTLRTTQEAVNLAQEEKDSTLSSAARQYKLAIAYTKLDQKKREILKENPSNVVAPEDLTLMDEIINSDNYKSIDPSDINNQKDFATSIDTRDAEEISEIKTSIDTTSINLETAEIDKKATKLEVKNLEFEEKELKANIAKLNKEIQSATDKRSEAEAQIELSKDIIEDAQNPEFGKELSAIAGATDSKAGSKAAISGYTETISEKEKERKKLETNLRVLEEKLKEARKSEEAAIKKHKAIDNELSELQEELKQLEDPTATTDTSYKPVMLQKGTIPWATLNEQLTA